MVNFEHPSPPNQELLGLPFPIKSLRRVFHVGLLGYGRQPSRWADSQEGTGLSVSLHPEAWIKICKLGGRTTYELRPTNQARGRFVNMTRLPRDLRERLTQICVARGDLTPAPCYRVWFYDEDEDDGSDESGMVCMAFSDEATARSEFEARCEDLDPGDQGEWWHPRFEVVSSWAATDKLQARWQQTFTSQLSVSNARAMALLFLLEDETDFDGAWWEDRLDPYAYHAPKGVIFQSRLPVWQWEAVS